MLRAAILCAVIAAPAHAQTADWTYPPLRSPESVIRDDYNAELGQIESLFAGVASDLADKIDASLAGSTGLALLGATTAGAARSTLGLGSAALQATNAFATAAQGALAESAVQPGDLATVATSGSYLDLSDVPLTFAPSAHTQAASTITDFAEAVDDRMAALLVAGSGVTLTYDDGAGTLTVAATGGGLGSTITLPASPTPTPPAADNVTIFGRSLAGRMLPAVVGPSGIDTSLQPFFGSNRVAMFLPLGNSNTSTSVGLAYASTGSGTSSNFATTNRYTRARGLEYLVTTAATTAVVGFRGSQLQFTIGASTAGDGGFLSVLRWGPATGVATATHRAFAGMRGAAAIPTDVQPSSLTNIVGMGWDAADANVQMMHNDASGTATKIDLGASFPVPTVDRTSMYEVAIFAFPGSPSQVGYRVTDLVSGAEASGTITTDLPANTQGMTPWSFMSVGGTSSVIGMKVFGHYIETDY
jgi:hypothetical protein